MTSLYEITATFCDSNGTRVECNTAEVLGEYYLRAWADRSAAQSACEELADDIGDSVDASTEYSIRKHELAADDGWYFLHPEGSSWIAVEVLGGRVVSRVDEANAATHAAAGDRFGGIAPSDDDTQCDEPLANWLTLTVMGDETELSMVDVQRAGGDNQ